MELQGRDGRACGSNCAPMKPGGSFLLSTAAVLLLPRLLLCLALCPLLNFFRMQRRDGILDPCSSTDKPLQLDAMLPVHPMHSVHPIGSIH